MTAEIPKAALVTGASKRIGRAISAELARAGFAVALHHRASAAEAETLAKELRSMGAKAVTLTADLSDEAAVGSLVARAADALGPIGVLVNNASVFEYDSVESTTRASWDQHLEVNLRAPFVLTQELAARLPAQVGGVVINLLDQRVWNLTPHFVSYTLSKAGLWTLTQTLALALAPRVRVNAIGPGPTLPSARQSEEQFATQVARLPLKRGATPDEIARAARFIIEQPAMTGQMIALDGGQHLNWSPAGESRPEE
ncbi:MAG: SDR family oxidoreductase [Alphaproteobacteria bacterium]|nr:SDR family oxidoreductase [Alphaproteobacteria bacterium]